MPLVIFTISLYYIHVYVPLKGIAIFQPHMFSCYRSLHKPSKA